MIGLRELRSTTGRLSWMAGILPRTRWAVTIMYAVVAAAEKDAQSGAEAERAAKRAKDQRLKENLVAVMRLSCRGRGWSISSAGQMNFCSEQNLGTLSHQSWPS